MCGVIAAWSPAGLAGAPLSAALTDLHHRGPEAQATLWRADHCLHLAHARLKIIDTSDVANQPFLSPCGRWAIVFNGEIYNYRELRQKIGDRWRWRTQSDTEVLMAAWALWGPACLDMLVGMFAFAVHDAEAQTLSLVRDRFGIKPLYGLRAGDMRIFASEIQPLLRFSSRVQPDESTVRSYLEHGLYDHGCHTFFSGVNALEPGSVLQIDLRTGSETAHAWYNLADHLPNLTGTCEIELWEQAEFLISQAVHSHLVSDVPLGLNVSGGVDSSMLVSAALDVLGHAHLFNQDYEGYSELPWVSEIAAGGTLHVSKLDITRITSLLHETVLSQAEPFGGVTVCGYGALYDSARKEGITVLLDGNGVDEVFLGYRRYHEIYTSTLAGAMEHDEAVADFQRFWGSCPRPGPVGNAIDGTNGLAPGVLTNQLLAAAPAQGREIPDFGSAVRQAAADDLLRAKIPRGLRFNDRVSMAYSRELRVPFLDHRLVEFGFAIPEEFLFGAQGTKLLFRKILAERVKPDVAFAAKRSVQSPQREWLANGWRPLVEEVLASASFADRGWVDPHKARAAYQRYLSGNQDNSFFIWQWINLELWARAFFDGAAPEKL